MSAAVELKPVDDPGPLVSKAGPRAGDGGGWSSSHSVCSGASTDLTDHSAGGGVPTGSSSPSFSTPPLTGEEGVFKGASFALGGPAVWARSVGPVKALRFNKPSERKEEGEDEPFPIYGQKKMGFSAYGQKEMHFSALFPDYHQKSTKTFKKENFEKIMEIASSYISLMLTFLREYKSKRFATDPHVGETSCQIRAAIFAQIFLNIDNVFQTKTKSSEFNRAKLEEDLIEAQKEIVPTLRLIHRLELPKLRLDYPTLSAFLDKTLGSISIPTWEVLFLTMSYALSDPFAPSTGHLNELFVAERLSLTKNPKLAVHLAKDMQVKLSQMSVDFVLDKALEFDSSYVTASFLENFKIKDEMGRDVLPIYFVSEVLAKIFESLNPTFELCLVDNSEGNRLTRFYNFNSSEDSYKSCFPSAGPRVFILAEVQPSAEERASFSLERRCDEIKDLGFANFLVNCAATHPQLNQKKFMARMSFLNAEKEAALEALEGVNADMVEPFIRQLSAESPVEFERFERARRGAKDAGFSKTSPRFAHLLHTCFLQGDGLLVSPESGAGRHIEG